jgi:hypothetical protein
MTQIVKYFSSFLFAGIIMLLIPPAGANSATSMEHSVHPGGTNDSRQSGGLL